MSHEHKVALGKIAGLCERSRTATDRTCRIYDIALGALGLTQNQREEKSEELISRKRALLLQGQEEK